MSDERQVDKLTGTETTGHSWDGIQELDTPMPAWWVWTFVATVVFALGYVVLYPAIPLVNSATQGVLGWNSRSDLTQEIAAANDAQSSLRQQIADTELSAILQDEELFQFASSAGRSAFAVNCSQCHGSGAAGGPGYPNLQDDDWIWGGDIENIYLTIAHGVRNGSLEARDSLMSAFGADEILTREQINDVTAYVLSLSGQSAERGNAAEGATQFSENCTACHGENAMGDLFIGAPNLTDPIWLFGSGEEAIASQIYNPQHGVMPAWQERLGDVTVKQLAVYVYGLGGGQETPTQ